MLNLEQKLSKIAFSELEKKFGIFSKKFTQPFKAPPPKKS
jgi:hypothetical protein